MQRDLFRAGSSIAGSFEMRTLSRKGEVFKPASISLQTSAVRGEYQAFCLLKTAAALKRSAGFTSASVMPKAAFSQFDKVKSWERASKGEEIYCETTTKLAGDVRSDQERTCKLF